MANSGICEKCENFAPQLEYVLLPANPDRMEAWCPDCRLALAQQMAAKEPGARVEKIGRHFAILGPSGGVVTQL